MSDFNPFEALIEGTPDVPKKRKSISCILEEIFAFTLDANVSEKRQLLYLEEVAKTFGRNDLDLLVLQHALFDRLFMCSDNNPAISSAKKKFQNSHSWEVSVLTYLCNCYRNLYEDSHLETGEKANVKSLVIQNTVTALIQSDIYEGQELDQQLIDILKDDLAHCRAFFKDTCKGVLDEEEGVGGLKTGLEQSQLVLIQERIQKCVKFITIFQNDQCIEKGVHLPGMSSETCLIPHDSDEEGRLQTAEKYNFVTECFYFAHKAINLGYQVTVDKLLRLNHEVSRVERAYADAVAQASGNNDLVDSLKQRMAQSLTKYLSMKAQLSDPVLLALLFEFTSTSAYWLCQVAVNVNFASEGQRTFAPIQEIPITFPLPTVIPATLKSIPECIIENLVCYLVFLRRFNPKIFEEQGKLEPILTFILIYMGSPERVKNPHLRARLAEALESLLPHHEDEPPGFNTFGGYQREKLFMQHEHRREIVSNLLKVFVGIEMTGQSVEFEQKFNYRRPMYTIMDYLWVKDEYKTDFKNLAKEAERNMNAVTPPLFLRFVNLLMNDAVYLLDESLANMAKLKEMQNARENGEWASLPAQERAQNLSYMHHIGMIAKFDNILGKDTIKTLEKLTSEITIVFTHGTMVDRVAAMLNYFLYNLVGPKKKNFKVKDQKEFSFDPATTVLNICKIYVNLKESNSFCLSITRDGRSYSPQLFELAEDVLVRIGGGALIGELKELADSVAKKAHEQQASEETMTGAPDHFLDPIMSTLMTDPVILPSSKQTVDRTTIARHLLSDQTDPFNRAPLSMDQVIPNTELAEEMRSWLEERKKK